MANTTQSQKSSDVLGLPEDRVDGRLKVTGAARYSAEMPVQNALHGVMVMSTIAKGQIVSMDTSAAQSQPGVVTVLTPFNAPKLPNNPGVQTGKPTGPQNRVLSVLQDTNVYYQNQPIGFVLAETLEAAQFAATLVKVAYNAETPTLDIDAERANIYKPSKANQVPTDSLRGDPDTALRTAPTKIEHMYSTPLENHNPMEPHATIAVWESPDHVTVYDATQGIFGVQGTLSHIWALPPSNVRCVSYFIGGGFGCKGTAWSHVALATLGAKTAGRPVKVVLSRQQMFGMVGYRPQTRQDIALGADGTGKLAGISHDVYTQTSTFDEFVEPSAAATRMLYACPNAVTTHRLSRLNLGTPTYMRAPGESSGTFALETAMDELAVALAMDPLDLRLANYAETDPDQNKPFSSKSLRECYEVGAKAFGWRNRSAKPGSLRTDDGLLIGYGLGTATYPARRSPSSAVGRVMPDGTAIFQAGTQDIGTGSYTVMRQIASDESGIPYDKTQFELGDTNMPKTPVSGGSMTAASTGSAVYAAAKALKTKLIGLAIADEKSPLYQLSPDSIDIKDGTLTAQSGKSEPVAALVTRQSGPYVEANGQSAPDQDARNYSMHSFGAVFTEVHVDPDLGSVRVARVVGAYGVGNRLNAKTARSQLIGGIVFGIGMALMEESHLDLRSGRIVNADLAEYHVPCHADAPPIDVIFVDEKDPYVNPLGVKGIGEIGITGVVGSLGNAIYNATETRVRDLPFTLDKVLNLA